MSVVLSMLKVTEHTDEPAFTTKAPISTPPTLIVMSELATYFVDDPGATLSSYLGIINLALETAQSFGMSVQMCDSGSILSDNPLQSNHGARRYR